MRAAYLEFAERYRPAAFTGRLAAVADKAEDLFLAGARAWGVLGEYESRNLAIERRRRRDEEARRRKGNPDDAFRIRTKLLDAREQYNTAVSRLREGDPYGYNGEPLIGDALESVLSRGAEAFGWHDARGVKGSGRVRLGVGVAAAAWKSEFR